MTLFKRTARNSAMLLTAATLALGAPTLALAGDGYQPYKTHQQTREEIIESFTAVSDYTEDERDAAVTSARSGLEKLDAEIERQQEALRENWAEMSEEAREDARAAVRDLQQARNALGEKLGALQAGAGDLWEDLKDGFADAYDSLAELWRDDNAEEADTVTN